MLSKLLSLALIAVMDGRAGIYATPSDPSTTRPADARPIVLGPGPHLFVDDLLIAESRGLRRVINRPSRDVSHANPIITGKGDGCFQPYMTVLRDAQTGRFRIWYSAPAGTTGGPSQSRLAYMESTDGIHWDRPRRLLDTPFIQFGVSVIDEGPRFADAQRRFKFAWWGPAVPPTEKPGLKLAASSDGFAWTQMTVLGAASDVLLPHNHDINGIFRDPLRNRYVAIASTYVDDPAWTGQRRVTTQSVSDDLLHWSPPWRVLVPDPTVEHPQTQFYVMDGFLVRGGLLIAMVKVLRDDLKADDPADPPDAYGIGYTALAWTRDGEKWTRDREPFFDRDPRRGAWDHAHAWIDEQVPVGDDVYLYYGGYARGHKVNRFEERQIGMVKMRRDRYVAREAGDENAVLVTPLVTLDADALTLNVDARAGEVRVQVRDEKGDPIHGVTLDDCLAPRGIDGLDVPVKWRGSLSRVRGRPVRLEFHLTHARLFALGLL